MKRRLTPPLKKNKFSKNASKKRNSIYPTIYKERLKMENWEQKLKEKIGQASPATKTIQRSSKNSSNIVSKNKFWTRGRNS